MLSFAKKTLKKILSLLLSLLPLRKVILFESNPDYACNTYPVYLEIKRRKEFRDYKLVWMVNSPDTSVCKDYIYKKPSSYFQKIKKEYYRYISKCIVNCNSFFRKTKPDQIVFFLGHGSPGKDIHGVYEVGQTADHAMVQSHFFDEIIQYQHSLTKKQLTYCGYPRCDYLYNCDKNIGALFGLPVDAKYVIWLPTFRKHKNGARTDAVSSFSNIGMPIIYDAAALHQVNQFAAAHDLYIFYKPHPIQDVSCLTNERPSHILIITDDDLSEKGLQLYELISKSSALITDYSSVYYDYLLLDRPIGTTVDDVGQYKNRRGFAFDIESLFDRSTERISNYDELIKFLQSVCDGVDNKREGRNEIKKLTNLYDDGNSAKRVADFVTEKLHLTGERDREGTPTPPAPSQTPPPPPARPQAG